MLKSSNKHGPNRLIIGKLKIFFCGAAAQRGPWPHHSWDF